MEMWTMEIKDNTKTAPSRHDNIKDFYFKLCVSNNNNTKTASSRHDNIKDLYFKLCVSPYKTSTSSHFVFHRFRYNFKILLKINRNG